MEDSVLAVEFYSFLDEETEFISYSVEFDLVNVNSDERTTIGYASLYFINTFSKNSWFDIRDAADGISGDMSHLIYELEDVLQQESDFLGLLAILDHLQINKAYRGKGLGSKALIEIVEYLETLSIDYLALIPSAFEEKDEEKKQIDIQRLIKFYNKFHLEVVNKQCESKPIMGRNLNHLVTI
ncbi:GNAT family N-acetyltransferase [Salicibibacter cibarius]|uniref:GNAT family N-acetyltransferase n=1 Tax=Salicibibacter cibarius TaxID=2743000 RepID=A0A7T6Z480_9BACI|nr:GNAT family N-acetyltransferase [Salicibibacter cibarius]QQK76508.1 GNAT family N-acetyltransferase [Salicibibacter cibarius]